MLLSDPNSLVNNTDSQSEKTVFDVMTAKRAGSFLNKLEDLAQSGRPEDVADFLSSIKSC